MFYTGTQIDNTIPKEACSRFLIVPKKVGMVKCFNLLKIVRQGVFTFYCQSTSGILDQIF